METIEQTEVKTETEDTSQNGKKLILHNDDTTSFEAVISSLIEICKLDEQVAVTITYIIHNRGKSIVQEGSEDVLKKMKDKFRSRDIIATIED